MQVMLGHIYIGMANQALNRGKINSQCLRLGNMSVTAAVRGQHFLLPQLRKFLL